MLNDGKFSFVDGEPGYEMKEVKRRGNLRVFSTILNITPPMWRSEVTLIVMGGDSGPKSSTITERSHAAILGGEPKTGKG